MKGQSSDVPASNYLLLTGVAKAKIIGLNPNNAKLKSLGFNVKEDAQEPEYTGIDINSETFSKLRFVLKVKGDLQLNDGSLRPYDTNLFLDFLISNRDDASSSGNVKYLNDFGATAYSSTKENPKMEWFWSKGNPKAAKQGECLVTEFLRAFLNVDPRTEGKIKDWSKIVNGNVSEIVGYLKPYLDNNFVYVLLGYKEVVNDDKVSYYQSVFNRHFVRGGIDNPISSFKKQLDNYQGNFLYQNDLLLKKLDTDNLPKPDSDNSDSNPFADSGKAENVFGGSTMNTSSDMDMMGEDEDPFK